MSTDTCGPGTGTGAGEPCVGKYRTVRPDLCSHGPDGPPAGLDVKRDVTPVALDLLNSCVQSLDAADLGTVAAQVSTAQPHLLRFYERYFRKQGSFPVYEREL